MKRRRLNRFFIYLFVLLSLIGMVAVLICAFQNMMMPVYILGGFLVVLDVLILRFFQVDGGHYQRKLKQEREKNRLIFSMVPELFTEEHPDEYRMQIDGDPDGDYGMEKGKVKKDVFLEHILPEHIERYNKAYRQILAGAALATANIRWKNEAGEYVWCEYHMTSVRNDEEQIEKIIGVLVNTDRKLKTDLKNQQIIKSVKKVYSRMIFLDLLSDNYEYLLRDDLVYYNYEKTGTFAKINQNYVENYVHPEFRDDLLRILSKDYLQSHLDAEHSSIVYRYRKNTETEQWEEVEAILVSLTDGQASQVLITVRDFKEPENSFSH